MTCRKRRQGQQRRLKKYIASQTGGLTSPSALLQREEELLHKIEEMNKQIEDHRQKLSQLDDVPPKGDTSTLIEKTTQEIELHEQQKKHLTFLIGMRDDMKETMLVNNRIYNALKSMNERF